METVFDKIHNITKYEKKEVLGFATFEREDFDDFSQIDHYGLLYRLYMFRGDKNTAKKICRQNAKYYWQGIWLLLSRFCPLNTCFSNYDLY